MRVADYIFKQLKDYGVKYVFIVAGGGAMFLNDAIKKSGLKYICFHHEQAAAIAAEGYARVNQELAVVCVTSGPGGLNCLTGAMGQFTDSVPVLYISGQVREETTTPYQNIPGLRQYGDQEVDITKIVKPITKYTTCLRNIIFSDTAITTCFLFATQGRKGPTWLDIPLNVQQSLCSSQDMV